MGVALSVMKSLLKNGLTVYEIQGMSIFRCRIYFAATRFLRWERSFFPVESEMKIPKSPL